MSEATKLIEELSTLTEYYPEMGGKADMSKLFWDTSLGSSVKIVWRKKDDKKARAALKKHRVRPRKQMDGDSIQFQERGSVKNPFNQVDDTYFAYITWNAFHKLADAGLSSSEQYLD